MSVITIDFIECAKEDVPVGARAIRDDRNGIYCYMEGDDYLQLYENYIELLNRHRKEWKNVGYLDLGMMPLVMAPSFMQESIVDYFCELTRTLNIPVYSMPPVSLLFEKCRITTNDIWVFKEDIKKVMGLAEDRAVSFSEFMRWCRCR